MSLKFFFDICILCMNIISCRVLLKSIRDLQKVFQVCAHNWHVFPACRLKHVLLIFELKNGTPAKYVPAVLQSIYPSKFFKKYCRRNFGAIDLTYTSYFGFVAIIFDENFRKNEKKRFLNFKSTYFSIYLSIDLEKYVDLLMRS